VFDVLDLCLECRACKAECPVGVDVARFKSEFLADYYSRHGVPARARAIGGIPTIAKFGSRFAPLSNVIAASGPARWIGEALFGIDRRRTLPQWSPTTFRERFTKAQGLRPEAQEPTAHRPSPIALFVDTFTNYSHPEIGVAAAAVLNAAGANVQLPSNGCCGRPLISQGLLADATKLAEANVGALWETAARGEPILFLEPSCLSAIKEDAPALLRGDLQRKARIVADACVLFEDFLEGELSRRRMTLPLSSGPSAVLLHGHCHQKAMGLNQSARALLSRIPSATVVDLDAGCCGMAGSFGYAQEHYEVSRQIGERRLLPAARAMQAGAVLVAAGTSCREQVDHFTGVRALHPAELLKTLLPNP
jgi:Fe-S oxidoreductase